MQAYYGAYIIFGIFAIISYLVGNTLTSKFKKYSQIPTNGGITGRDVAIKMIQDNGIRDVKVVRGTGTLTDHYNPVTKTVSLSPDVYNRASIAAAAVAAHECGHVVQHATSYKFLKMRSKLVPVVSFASKWMMWVLLAGIALIQVMPEVMLAGIILFGLTTLFSFVTLPVEINASKRAVAWLQQAGITNSQTKPYAVDALKWAAYTYVISALGSLATLIYYIMIYTNNRR